MAPHPQRARSRKSKNSRKHSHLSVKPYHPSPCGDESNSNSEVDYYPQSAEMTEASKPVTSAVGAVGTESDALNELDFEDDADGFGSSGIESSGGWSENSSYSTTSSSSNDLRDLERKLHDSTGNGLDLISLDAKDQKREDHTNNSGTVLSLTKDAFSFASPNVAPAQAVSFGDTDVGKEQLLLSPMMMGGSEESSFPYNARYEGSLSDLMMNLDDGVDDSDGFHHREDDDDDDDSAGMPSDYLSSGAKQSRLSRKPNLLLKPNVGKLPPTPPSPIKRSVGPSLGSFATLAVDLETESLPGGKRKEEENAKKMDSGKDDEKKKRTGKKQPNNKSKAEKSTSGKDASAEYGFSETCCNCGSRDVGPTIRQCMSCKEAYVCEQCMEGKAVTAHMDECAIWKAQGKPEGRKPVLSGSELVPEMTASDVQVISMKEKPKREKSSNSVASTKGFDLPKDGQGVISDPSSQIHQKQYGKEQKRKKELVVSSVSGQATSGAHGPTLSHKKDARVDKNDVDLIEEASPADISRQSPGSHSFQGSSDDSMSCDAAGNPCRYGDSNDFYDRPLQQHCTPAMEDHTYSHGSEKLHDDPQQKTRELPHGDDLGPERRPEDPGFLIYRRNHRYQRLIIMLAVALGCALLALAAVVGGIVAVVIFDDDNNPAPVPAPVVMPVDSNQAGMFALEATPSPTILKVKSTGAPTAAPSKTPTLSPPRA